MTAVPHGTLRTAAPDIAEEMYSPQEIAAAAGLAEDVVARAIGGANRLIRYKEAVRLARALRSGETVVHPMFGSTASALPIRSNGRTLALSGSIHLVILVALAMIAALGLTPIESLASQPMVEPMRLVYLASPGPGGGGGGGGRREERNPPKALREGKQPIGSPLPVEQPPPPVEPVKAPEPLPSRVLPAIVAPIAASAPDPADRPGLLEEARKAPDSGGPGTGSGIGSGTGSGLGEGNGAGIGPGSGGGIGGGPYRPGSGVEPPRLLNEVKPTYPEDARRRAIGGTVDMEIVVRRDGSVGDVRILKGLADDFNTRAIQAVRQWRFEPGHLKGTAVDVLVEVTVEFRMR